MTQQIVALFVLIRIYFADFQKIDQTNLYQLSTFDSIPFQLVENSGLRPIIPVRLNDSLLVTLMVHGNSGSFITLTHNAAERITNKPIPKKQAFGFAKDNTVSDKGRGSMVLTKVRTGNQEFNDITCDVFDLGNNPPYQGMLGLQWLLASQAIIDFGQQLIYLPNRTTGHSAWPSRINLADYQVLDLTERTNRRLVVHLSSLKGRKPAAFVVSTVSTTSLDSAYFHAESFQSELMATGRYMSPKGSMGTVYTANNKLTFFAGRLPLRPLSVNVYDQFDYVKEQRGADFVAGDLGADFMLQNKAIIDFGAKKLYLKK